MFSFAGAIRLVGGSESVVVDSAPAKGFRLWAIKTMRDCPSDSLSQAASSVCSSASVRPPFARVCQIRGGEPSHLKDAARKVVADARARAQQAN